MKTIDIPRDIHSHLDTDLLNNLPLMIRWSSSAGCFYNRAWLQFTGRTFPEETQNGWPNGIHPDDLDRYFAHYQQATMDQQTCQIEYRYLRADGQYRWLLETGSFSPNPGHTSVSYLASCVDITEHKNSLAAPEEGPTDRESLLAQTENRLKRLVALHTIDVAISATLDLRRTLEVLLEQVILQLGVDAADVKLLNPKTYTLEYATGRGFRISGDTRPRSRLSERLAMQAAIEHHMIQIPDFHLQPGELGVGPLVIGEDFCAYMNMPLIAKDQVKGVLEVYRCEPFYPDEEWLSFFTTLCGQAAIAIDNATLFESLQRSKTELEMAYDSTLEGWSHAMDLRDRETEGHSQRVADLSVALASALGIEAAELTYLRWGALLHDIGKMGIPDNILLKNGDLDENEWAKMRQHPYYAYQMLEGIPYLRPALDIPYCHHEKWDGTGYPRGLKGEEIPMAARIFAVIDVWDALSSDRPYRNAWPKEDVLEFIARQADRQFDPQVVTAFLKLIESM